MPGGTAKVDWTHLEGITRPSLGGHPGVLEGMLEAIALFWGPYLRPLSFSGVILRPKKGLEAHVEAH